jgi:hypothetical protein
MQGVVKMRGEFRLRTDERIPLQEKHKKRREQRWTTK